MPLAELICHLGAHFIGVGTDKGSHDKLQIV